MTSKSSIWRASSIFHQAFDEILMDLRAGGTRISPFVMGQAGYMHTVPYRTREIPAILPCFERQCARVKQLPLLGPHFRDDHSLPHMPDDLISHQEYRDPEPVRKIECPDRHIKHLLDTHGPRAMTL